MALVDERRKTLSARLDNTRFRVELEATKHARTASTEVATMARPCLSEGQRPFPQIREAARLGMCVRKLAPCTELAPSTEQEAAKAWKHAWEEAETEYAEKETKLANQLETDRLKLEHDLAEVTKSKEEEFEELIREEVERREVRARAPAPPRHRAPLPPPNLVSCTSLRPPLQMPTPLRALLRRSCQR